MSKMEDRYIGDGVYASCDGYHIILDLRAQDNTTRIALEPAVMKALIKYYDDIVTMVRNDEAMAQKEDEALDAAAAAEKA